MFVKGHLVQQQERSCKCNLFITLTYNYGFLSKLLREFEGLISLSHTHVKCIDTRPRGSSSKISTPSLIQRTYKRKSYALIKRALLRTVI